MNKQDIAKKMTDNIIDLDILTSINILNYVQFALFHPYKITKNDKIVFAIMNTNKDDDVFSSKDIYFATGIRGNSLYNVLKELKDEGVISPIYKEHRTIHYELTDRDKCDKYLDPLRDALGKNAKNLNQEILTNIYNSLVRFYVGKTGDKNRRNLSDLILFYSLFFDAFVSKAKSINKKRMFIEADIALAYISIFGEIDVTDLQRLMPYIQLQNLQIKCETLAKKKYIKFLSISRQKKMTVLKEGSRLIGKFLDVMNDQLKEEITDLIIPEEFVKGIKAFNHYGSFMIANINDEALSLPRNWD